MIGNSVIVTITGSPSPNFLVYSYHNLPFVRCNDFSLYAISPYKRPNSHYFFTIITHFSQTSICRRRKSEMVVGRSNSNNKMIPYQTIGSSSRGTSSGIRKSALRFRGVLPLANHKWGARISFNYKAYWLGTYQIEEEAAIAYDRAALKLQKTDTTPLNVPHRINILQEKSFQSWYSDDEILNMIKDKTYSLNLSRFLAHRSLARRTIPGGVINVKALSYKMLFYQELTPMDVTNPKGFQIPKEFALRYFPPLGNSSGNGAEMGTESTDIVFYDKYYGPWTLRYSYSGPIQAFCFTKGWRLFVTLNDLKSGDIVIFYICHHVDQAGQMGMFYMIDIQRNIQESYIVSNGEGQGSGSEAVGMEAGGKKNGVKLFGVNIG